MKPTPAHNKYLLPVVLIIGLVIITSLFIMKGGAIDQGAALFNAATQTSSLRGGPISISPSCRPTPGPNGRPVPPAPSIKVTSPNGGEMFMAGQQITVNWTNCNYSAPVSIVLAYYPAGSTSYTHAQNILSSSTGLTVNDGSEVVTLPTAALMIANNDQFGTFYKILVTNGGSPQTATIKDDSDSLFTISTPSCNTANGICLIGGNNDGGWEKDAWVFNTTQNIWSQLTPNAAFGGRYAFSLLSYAGKNWVLGGWSRVTNDATNDVWSSLDGISWTQVIGSAPWSKRWYSAGVVFNNKMWVLGGGDPNGTLYNDVWSSTNGSTWTQATANAPWSARIGLKALVLNNKLWVIGGTDGAYLQNDVWSSLDGISWTQATANAPWNRRGYFGATVFQNKLWVIGGYDQSGNMLNDVWSSPDGVTWTQVVTRASWSPRSSMNLVVSGNKLWLLAGRDNTSAYLNDVWSSTNGSTWTHVDSDAAVAGIQDAPWTGRWNASAIAQ